ncbi:MAG: AAA family ATPase [Lachnospiraceae bacterium]|nr:AAA family ATPase [Lachnospiraceae bacterium]
MNIIDTMALEVYNNRMRNKIIGRTREYARLDKCMREDVAQLVLVYGRRRVGKTFLVNQYFENTFSFKLTGAYDKPKTEQLQAFVNEYNRKTHRKAKAPLSWTDAFELLREYIDSLDPEKKCVIFFDEMPWLDSHRSGFLAAFEYFWNDYGSSVDNLVFIVCGSATSWLVDNIEHNKGGLFNRQTCKLFLEPFSLSETEDYLVSKGIRWSRYDITECYMVMGGIPYYLSLLDKEMSYLQNIDYLFFRKKAELWDEFDHLYNTLFLQGDTYISVVCELSKTKNGLTREEISKKTKLALNGVLSKIIKNLVDSGFVRENRFWGKKKKETLYQLADYYSNFYFHYIKDNAGQDEHYWSNTLDSPSRKVWAGNMFEQVCKDHIWQIKQRIGISGILSNESVWFTKADKESGIPGTQIDLVIDRRDRVINLCEMKYSLSTFTIDKDYDETLRKRIEVFRSKTGTKKAVQIVFVTTYGVESNQYSGIVQRQVLLDDLFKRQEW